MSVYRERISELRRRLEGADPSEDAVLITQPENRRYLSGFKACDPQLTESSGFLLVGGDFCVLITDSRYTLEAREEAVDFEICTAQNGLPAALQEELSSRDIKRLGFEEYYLTCGLHREIKEKLASVSLGTELVPMRDLVEGMREKKDASELKYLEESADLISGILEQIIDGLKPGMTERETAWEIEGLVREGGAEGVAFPPIVASGPNSALPHAVPTDRKLKEGEPVIMDVGARVQGYCSDMTRTVFLGEPDPEFMDIYRTVREAQVAALEIMKQGLLSTDADGAARERINKAGLGSYFGHGLGHGVGLATHEGPRLGPKRPMTLEKGMVVTVEPGVYLPGKGGVRLEEMVLVLENGVKILTKAPGFYDFSS